MTTLVLAVAVWIVASFALGYILGAVFGMDRR